MIVPERIAAPIKKAVIAVKEELRNAQQIETAKSAARLAFESSLAKQNQRKVEAETRKLERQLNAEAAANEAKIEAKGRVTVSQLAFEASKVEARSIPETGKANAEVVRLEQEAQTAGMISAVAAFGDPKAHAMYEFATHLSPNVKVVCAPAGEGTLWTSLDEFFQTAPKGPTMKIVAKREKVRSIAPGKIVSRRNSKHMWMARVCKSSHPHLVSLSRSQLIT